MFITDLDIQNFGPFANKSFSISPHLTVILGPNEAGKSAIRAFIRMVLFGFLRKNSTNPPFDFNNYPPAIGGVESGSISIRTTSGLSYTVRRERKSGSTSGPVTITGYESGDEELLGRLIGNIDQTVYQNIFSVSLEELAKRETIAGGQISDRIYSAGLGLGSISLPGELEEIEKESRKLWGRRNAGLVREAMKEIGQKTILLNKTRADLQKYEDLKMDEEKIGSNITAIQREIGELQIQHKEKERLVALRGPWDRDNLYEQQLKQLLSSEAFPQDGLEKYAEGTREKEELERKIREGNREVESREQNIQRLDIVKGFEQNKPEVRRLITEIAHYQKASDDLPDLHKNLDIEESQMRTNLSELKFSLDAAQAETEHLGLEAGTLVRHFELSQDRDIGGIEKDALDVMSQQLQRLQAKTRDKQNLDQQIWARTAQLASVRDSKTLNPWWAFAAAVLTGFIAILIGAVLGEISGVAAGLLILIVGSGMFYKTQYANTRSSTTTEELDSMKVLGDSIGQLRRDQAILNEEIEKLLTSLKLQELPSDGELVAKTHAIQTLIIKLGELRSQMPNLNQFRQRVSDVKATLSDIESRLSPILDEAGIAQFQQYLASYALQTLEQRFQTHEDSIKRLQVLQTEASEWDNQLADYQHALGEVTSELTSLLSAAKCNDASAFQLLGGQAKTRQELITARNALHQIHPQLVSQDGKNLRAELMAISGDQAEVELENHNGVIADKQNELLDQVGEQATTRDERERTEKLNSANDIQFELEILQEKLKDNAHRWAVLAIAKKLLEDTKEEFQEGKQGPLLQVASEHLNRFTCGKYSGVRVVVGEEKLQVVEPSKRTKETTELSRGTAEQLYLAMRFAWIDEYSRNSESMPVLLDDVMVNFDPERFRAVCDGIINVSSQHQVLVLTCHPTTVGQLQAAAVDAGAPEISVIEIDPSQ